VVGGDAGALAAPYRADTLMVVPGERYEVLIDFDDAPGTELSLETIFYDRGHGVPDPGPATLLSLEVGAAGSARPGPMPTALVQAPTPLSVTGSTTTRKLVLEEQEDPTGATETSFTINQQRWPFNTPLMVQVGDTEVWELDNRAEMDHPFHLHGMFFQVLDVAGVPAARLAWKDTVNVPQKSVLRLAVRYETVGMWMYHCHILEHAERGMMGELMVMPPP
jgi:FtsP/CotA-like multicopper oxidase with cupredoxin domain